MRTRLFLVLNLAIGLVGLGTVIVFSRFDLDAGRYDLTCTPTADGSWAVAGIADG